MKLTSSFLNRASLLFISLFSKSLDRSIKISNSSHFSISNSTISECLKPCKSVEFTLKSLSSRRNPAL